MSKSIVVITTLLLMAVMSVGSNHHAIAQQNTQPRKAKAAKVGNAAMLGVQEVGLQSWQPQPKQLPEPEEISVGLPPQVKLTPGPEKPANAPENEDHRGVQVKVLNP